jgi:serine/threonine-protein kinase HipA
VATPSVKEEMSLIKSVKEVKVGINFGEDVHPVGRLAIRDRQIYFEYDQNFIEVGLEISPLRLPIKSGVQNFDYTLFEGLSGVFNKSLLDG